MLRTAQTLVVYHDANVHLTIGLRYANYYLMNEHPLATARNERGLSQAACAKLVGCKRWMINRIEANERRPSPQLAEKIEAVTGVDARVLLGIPQRGVS